MEGKKGACTVSAEAFGDFAGSSIGVPTGADGVPGLAEALKDHKQDVRK